MSNYEKPGADDIEKNFYEPFAKKVTARVRDQIKSGGYHGNLDGDFSVTEIADSVTRTLCVQAQGKPENVTTEMVKEAVQKRMEDLGYDGHHDKAGGYTPENYV